jgi:hypothetical protein
VWTAHCRLHAADITAAGPGAEVLLLDTKAMRFEPRQAPY